MDCKNARLVLATAHPLATELDARDKAELAGHLADCPDCGPFAESECRLDECLGKAVRAVPLPPGLAQRIERRLAVERDAWYRGWTVRAAGVAAALLLTCWLSWALWLSKKPTPNLAQLQQDVDIVLTTPEQVEQAFAFRGVTMTAPPQFQYSFLQGHDLVAFQGKEVPQLLFAVAGNNAPLLAKVYVLSDQAFDIDLAKKQVAPAGSHWNIKVLPHPTNPRVVYLVVWPAGRPLTIFLKEDLKANA